jgi:hypothetical protein
MTTTLTSRNITRTPSGGGILGPYSGGGGGWIPENDPALSSVTGTWAEDEVLTLTGTNLSAEGTEYHYTDFSEDANDALVSFFYHWTGVNPTGPTYLAKSDSDQPLGGKAAVLYGEQESLRESSFEFDAAPTVVYMEAFIKVDIIDGTSVDAGGGQVKLTRIVRGVGEEGTQDQNTQLAITWQTQSNWMYAIGSQHPSAGNKTARNSSGTEIQAGTGWKRVEMAYVWSDLNTANGGMFAKWGDIAYFGSSGGNPSISAPTGAVDQNTYEMEPFATQTTTNAGNPPRRVLPPYYQRADQTSRFSLAHVSMVNSLERVVVGNASTWAACDRQLCWTLPEVSKSETQRQVTVKESALNAGPRWFYIVNHNGKVNANGVQI